MKKIRVSALIFIFFISSIITVVPITVYAEDSGGGLSQEIINQILSDKDIPPDIKQELEEMYASGELEKELDFGGVEDNMDAAPSEPVGVAVPSGRKRVIKPTEGAGRTPQSKKTPAPARKNYTNTISLDLKGVDIIDVLKMLSTRSNLNIVAGKNVRGRVTLFLKDVDVWEAFEIILAANSLAYEKTGDIINVMTERDYERLYGEAYNSKKELRIYKLEYAKAIEVSKALNQAKSKIGKVIVDEGSNTIVVMDSLKTIRKIETMIAKMDLPVETRIFSLNYATAEDVKTKISEMLTKGVGVMQVDERTNKVVITELSSRMPELSQIIDEMDERHKEVLIEAKIVQISLNDQYRYGIDWKAAFSSLTDQGVRLSLDNVTGNVFGDGATGGTLTLASVASRNINAVLEALQTIGKTNVISSPRITVLNNEEAKVLVGTVQPYIVQETVTGDGIDRTNENILEKDVGVSLAVTPTINNEGFVTMKIKPKISSITDTLGTSGDRDSIPVISTSESETTVMIKDGTTVVIAGLIEDRDEEAVDKIPILGDIPILGNLFKNTSRGNTSLPEKKELVVFLTPYIIHGTETFPEAKNIWYSEDIAQEKLLGNKISLGVEGAHGEHIIKDKMPEVVEKEDVDNTTRISEDVEWIYKDFFKPEEEGLKKAGDEEAVTVREGIKDEEAGADYASQSRVPLSSSYYHYYVTLRNKIFWVAKDLHPKSTRGQKKDVVVMFTLFSDGSLKNEPRILNDVGVDLAMAAKDAVELAAPFPAFPIRMDKEEEMFKITITYK